MSLLRYLKPANGLPNPKGSLSTAISPEVISEMNKEVEETTRCATEGKKRGPYKTYSPSERSRIGKYAFQHGATAASRHFSTKLKKRVSRSTAKSMKKAYEAELRERRRCYVAGTEEITDLPAKKRGRKLLIGEDLDQKVQLYLRKVREGGGAVSAWIATAAARGILRKCNRSMLAENGGPIQLNRHWAHSLLKRMKFVQRKATTSMSKHTMTNFKEQKRKFLSDIATTVEMEEIPGELVLNWDQTGIRLVPSSTWTMERRGERRIEMIGVNDKRQITAVFCGNALGVFLPPQLIYKGKSSRCHPRYEFPSDWNITHSPNHWSNEDTMLQYIDNIILPYVANVRDYVGADRAALVVVDNFKGQTTEDVIQRLDENNILISWLPPNTTDRLQPMDLSVNKPVKEYLKKQFEEWYSEMVMEQLDGKDMDDLEYAEIQPINLGMPILKEVGAKWLDGMAQYFTDNPHLIINGFIRSGISSAIDGVVNMGSEDDNSSSEELDSSDIDSGDCDSQFDGDVM